MYSPIRAQLSLMMAILILLQACSAAGQEYLAPISSSMEAAWAPNPEYRVGFAWFYKPPDDEHLPFLASNFNFFILTHRDEEQRDTLQSLGATQPILRYLQFIKIHDPGDCETRPRANQVAYLPGDFCRISLEHPDWFLLDQYGNRIVNENDYYNMDPGHPGFQAFWLERAGQLQRQYGWQGIFLDNVEASLSKYKRNGALPQKYPTDASLQSAVEEFLSYLRNQYGGPLYANIISVRDKDVWLNYMGYLDGAMLENFAVDWRGSDLSNSEWAAEMEMLSKSQQMGRELILVSQGHQDDLPRQQFAYASYLLLNDGLAYFRYAHSSAYREIWWYENYNDDLGKPLGPAYEQGGRWFREFEHGRIVMDPRSGTADFIFFEATP
jgi:hypothetical protein